MATSQMSEVLQHLRRTVLLREGVGPTDGQLLEDYICRQDEAALAALVRRHGPMVWGVCRRVLPNYHDAEDAFQAAFLVLVRKAASIRSRGLVANWLYGVARQTAVKARATAAKRRARERQVTQMPEPAAAEQAIWQELRPVLDEELSRLPDKYRAVIVLCDLEGKTRKEAARHLGVPEGTVASRMATARRMLAKRLARHGLAVSGGALAAVLAGKAASAGVPASVVSSTIKAASLYAAGQAAAAVRVAALAEGVLKSMSLTKLKTATGVLVLLAALSGGAGLIYRTQAAEPPNADRPKAARGETTAKNAATSLAGSWKAVSLEVEGERQATDTLLTKKSVKEITWAFTDKKLKIRAGGKTIEAGYTLDPSTAPKKIDLTFHFPDDGVEVQATALGIYSLEGDTLKVCFILDPLTPVRPLEFDLHQFEANCYTFRREGKPQRDTGVGPEAKKGNKAPSGDAKPLGHVLRITNQGGKVYINLGKADNVDSPTKEQNRPGQRAEGRPPLAGASCGDKDVQELVRQYRGLPDNDKLGQEGDRVRERLLRLSRSQQVALSPFSRDALAGVLAEHHLRQLLRAATLKPGTTGRAKKDKQ